MSLGAKGAALSLCFAAACAAHVEPRNGSTPAVVTGSARPCGGCHAAAEEGWNASLHKRSFVDRDFQNAYRDDPGTFCADCHAPRRRDLDAETAAPLGVDCVSCHDNALAHERAASRGAPRVAMTTKPCASCHEFANPMAGTMLQTTTSEHTESAYSGVACVECHMRSTPNRTDHEMAVTRNAKVLSKAIAHDVRESGEQVVVSLRSVGVGHRFPTGDLFRALRVRAWIEAPDGRILSETTTLLHRDWDAARRVPGTTPKADTRLAEAPVELELPSPAEPKSRVRVEVDYARGATARGDNFTMFSSLRIADWTTPLVSEGASRPRARGAGRDSYPPRRGESRTPASARPQGPKARP